MKIKNLTQITRALVVRLALLILKHSSDGAVVKLFDTSLYITREKLIAQKQISSVKQAWLQGKPLARLVHRALHDLNLKASTYLVNNLVFNNSYGSSTKAREKFFQSEGFFPPYTLLISPTMRCNLKCVGCYASEYTRKDDLPPEVFNRVLSEARDLGIYFITVLGGEPFLREDLWDMCARYHDLYFNVFTNGTLITDASLKQLKRLGNVAVTVSLEGMQEVTDARRGQGVFARTMQAFDDLRSAGLLYGFSTMVTRQKIME
nr:radical SAM protein [Anaerolineaceae bacterium]